MSEPRFNEPEPVEVEGRIAGEAGPAAGDAPLHGQLPVRGSSRVSVSSINEGRFGRMFRRLPALPPYEEAVIKDLAERMREELAPTGWGGAPVDLDNPKIPAGYTYLGQFIDHDITFDPASSLERLNDADALHDFRSPRFDLDSLYGSGPIDEPFQYRRGSGGMQMILETNALGAMDLPRNSEGIALIGDPRNDENVIVSQLQMLFVRLHNKLSERVLADGSIPEGSQFAEVQRRVRWLYQWVVVHDYLPRIIGEQLFGQIFHEEDGHIDIRRPNFQPRTRPYMPVEFSVAAFRFGHSQVRGIYHLNDVVRDRPIFSPGPLAPEPPDQDLRGFRPLPQRWAIEWDLFFGAGDAPEVQLGRRIDARLVPALFDLPDGGGSLAFRNLRRGEALGLPSGQDVAAFLKIPILSPDELAGAPVPTPLWFYILKEAELRGEPPGLQLGRVGGRIVGEVLLGLLELDRQSWFSQSPGWQPLVEMPDLDLDGDGRLTMLDLARFATPPPDPN